MSSLLPTLAVLLGVTAALPSGSIDARDSSADGPVRILPYNWQFNITALSGPGCPDFSTTGEPFTTRPTFGSNTVDGSEIYYWHFAYPHLRAAVGADKREDSVWCETTLQYTELDEHGQPPAVPGYRLKLHTNATEMIAAYDLDEGVEVNWKFTFETADGKQIVDEISIQGPRFSTEDTDYSPEKKLVQWALPGCGTGTIKYRTELTVRAKKDGAKGSVSSEQVNYQGKLEYYGAQQGVSYDWEKCTA
ncbi:uncharacterized protein THITE_123413 [Thermothielavioides terrestris NRRL 8126]|uniref:Uncharacterized protein n=1 Tax=Thermothielavioides terrestris (strain ATCC 38088 / NRRL 8126) TaxID=578455 RepID=G2QWY2_THETT|nr:uncharacterized protein THITE_123413 [Thermothielavioides terrestris NRRL 8126]AEO63948.1 hypothetical protein THITE_123413 [Thermothielavioides terrestris NRRL 8126]